MEAINNILIEGLKDLRAAIDQGKKPARNYESQKELSYNPTNARFKLVVWLKNGRSRWYYSFDNVHQDKKVHFDEWNGLKKLIRLVENSLKDQYKNAIIYANVNENKRVNDPYDYEIIKYNYLGQSKQAKMLNFKQGKDQKSIIFDFEKLKLYGSKKIV